MHLFQITLTTGNGKVPDQVPYSVIGALYSLKNRTTMRPRGILPKGGSLAFQKYDFQLFQKEIFLKNLGFMQCALSGQFISTFFIFL